MPIAVAANQMIAAIAAALLIVFWIWMVTDIARRRDLKASSKALWLVFGVVVPGIALLAYSIAGRRKT